MLPKLRGSAIIFKNLPHLVIVSSELHFWSTFEQRYEPKILDALADQKKADMGDRYSEWSFSTWYPTLVTN